MCIRLLDKMRRGEIEVSEGYGRIIRGEEGRLMFKRAVKCRGKQMSVGGGLQGLAWTADLDELR